MNAKHETSSLTLFRVWCHSHLKYINNDSKATLNMDKFLALMFIVFSPLLIQLMSQFFHEHLR